MIYNKIKLFWEIHNYLSGYDSRVLDFPSIQGRSHSYQSLEPGNQCSPQLLPLIKRHWRRKMLPTCHSRQFSLFLSTFYLFIYTLLSPFFYGFLVSFEIGLIWGRVSLDLKSFSKIVVFSYGCLSFVSLGKLLWSCTGLYSLHACYFN